MKPLESEQKPVETVLIIEDDRAYCELVERQLASDGFCVRSAGTMQDGLNVLHNEHPDAVVLDLGLPDSPVNESVERVKRCTDSAIIVVLSGNPDAAHDCISKSASGFLHKEAGLKYLATEIRNAIRTFSKIQRVDAGVEALRACRT